MDEQQQWYVTIAGNAVGPVSTDLVLRGIKHKKIATGAYVCVVGASEWLALTDVPEFHGALEENGLLPSAITEEPPPHAESTSDRLANANHAPMPLSSAGEDDEFETTSQFPSSRLAEFAAEGRAETTDSVPHDSRSEGTHVPLLATQPGRGLTPLDGTPHDDRVGIASPAPVADHGDQESLAMAGSSAHARDDDGPVDTTEVAAVAAPGSAEEPEPNAIEAPSQPRNGKHAAAIDAHSHGIEVDIDVHISLDEPEVPAINWNHGFSEYFLVDADVTLPDEQLLLRSLTTTPHDTFLHDEPMWNLALCLAFGSNAVASVAADVFFDVVAAHAQQDRIEWMARTLLSRGFMPSGIPHAAGNLAIGRLRQACPEELRVHLESQLGM